MVTTRPVLAVVQRSCRGQAAHSPVKVARRCWKRPRGRRGDGVPGGAGDRAGVCVDEEVVQGEPADHGGLERGRLDQQPVPGGRQVGAQLGSGVGGIGQDLQRAALIGEQAGGDGGLVVLSTGAGTQGNRGEQASLRFNGQVAPCSRRHAAAHFCGYGGPRDRQWR
ncbi:hypothetical protein [Nonomuraea sp. NPDC049141]|uniref:hypothetical protein n=1 Tax=Nonomuraea sp. NPDC049141 TaxID=3155500 RepID=UPI00340DF31B